MRYVALAAILAFPVAASAQGVPLGIDQQLNAAVAETTSATVWLTNEVRALAQQNAALQAENDRLKAEAKSGATAPAKAR